MPERIKIGYVGIGRYLPEKVLTNERLEQLVDTTDEWIKQRTGIQTRRIMCSDESVASMAIAAAGNAIENAGIDVKDISCVRIGVNTHLRFPSLAAIVQDALKIPNASASDISAGCSGFIFGVEEVFNRLHFEWMMFGRKSYGLVIGVEGMSLVTNWTDRKTCVLFGDAAGAVIIGPVQSGEILATHTRTQGEYADLLKLDEFLEVPAENHKELTFKKFSSINYPFLSMEGPKVFVVAVRSMVSEIKTVLKNYNQFNGTDLTEKDIEYVYPHQANMRIISAIADSLKIPHERVYSDGVKNYGNTSTASIPIAYVDKWGMNPDALVIDVSFGSGFTSGAILRKTASK